MAPTNPWPELPLSAWNDTRETLHRWTQIVGKIRLAQAPALNHSWHSTLYVTCRGLTTSPVPCGDRSFQIDLDFIDHVLAIQVSDGAVARVPLQAESVARFHGRLQAELHGLGLHVRIHPRPNELPDALPFEQDEVHRSYDGEYVRRFWQILVQSERVMQRFRGRFLGKCSPVHLFWGGLDLAVTRFSGRRAPEHPGGIPNMPDRITREAYSHEVSSCGFWAGGGAIDHAAFYSYAYPEPPGFATSPVRPAGAFYSPDLREFILPYDVVRLAPSPYDALLEFLQSTFDAAASCGQWDRAALER